MPVKDVVLCVHSEHRPFELRARDRVKIGTISMAVIQPWTYDRLASSWLGYRANAKVRMSWMTSKGNMFGNRHCHTLAMAPVRV